MKQINTYILEKLIINKDTTSHDICIDLCEKINDYCKNTLHLDTKQYMIYCADDKGDSCYSKPEKLHRIYFWSKEILDLNKISKELASEFNSIKKVKDIKLEKTAINFIF